MSLDQPSRRPSTHATLLRTFLAFVLCAMAAAPSAAQVDRAVLEGTVSDSTGAVVAKSSITVLAVETGISEERQANSLGYYRFPGLAVGRYTVTVTSAGFKTSVIEKVVLQVGQTRTLDVQLTAGGFTEKMVINVDDGPSQRSSAEASLVIGKDEIASLPTNGRDWSNLSLLAPFAQDDGGGNQRSIRFAGRAIDDNNFNFDGVDAGGIQEQAQKSQVRLQVSEDAIAEYRVTSALYGAEYGTQAGGQIDVVTKSGTNDLHGSVFGYLRNSVFDARNFNDFDLNGKAAIPPFRQGQYGLTLGGPIKKDKTFYFISFEGLRALQGQTQTGFVPSAFLINDVLVNGRGGQGPTLGMCPILQAFPWRKSTGTVGGCTPKIVVQDTAFTPVSSDLDSEQFTHATPAIIHEDSALIRIDHKINDKTTLYGRAQRDILHSDQPISALYDVQKIVNHPANYFIALSRAFNANVFNESKVFVNRSPYHNPQASTLPYAVNINSNSGFTGINNNSADIEVGTTFGFIDNLTWTHGRHTFKTGMEIRRVRLNQGQTENNTLNFSDNQSLVSGTLSKVDYIAPWCCHKYRRTFYLPYFQDEFKVTPSFTATLGVRWEYYGVANVPDNRTTVFDFNQFHGACLGSGSLNTPFTVPSNTPPCPKNPDLYQPDYKNFDPRVSFAWAPTALHNKTVVRAGFGIYHGAAQNDDLNAGLESDTFRASISGAIPISPGLLQAIPDLSGFPRTANHPRALQRQGRRDLYSETWGLTVEQALPAGLVFNTSYLGSHGVRLFSRGALNLCVTPVFVTKDSGGNFNCTRPLDQYFPKSPDPYGSVDYKYDVGQSTYHAVQFVLERRFAGGLAFQGRYNFSHSINDGAVGGGEANGPQNVNCHRCDKGPSVFDVRHNITTNATYELPFGPGKTYMNHGGALGKVVGGWELSGIGTFHTGHPLTVSMDLSGSDPNTGVPFNFLLPDGNDQTTQRPDLVPGVPLYLPGNGRHMGPWINPAAFQAPPIDSNGNFTRFGNAGNGILRDNSVWQIDVSLMKQTKITERIALQFEVQAFNVFNHTQLGDPNNLTLVYNPQTAGTRLDAPSQFGEIVNPSLNQNGTNTGTNLPRQLQFEMRVKF